MKLLIQIANTDAFTGSYDLYIARLSNLSTGIAELNENSIQLFPNPFSTSTALELDIKTAGKINLTVFNSTGQVVMMIHNITKNRIQIEKNILESGVYFCRIEYDNKVDVRKLIVD